MGVLSADKKDVREIRRALVGCSLLFSQNRADFLVRGPEGVGWH